MIDFAKTKAAIVRKGKLRAVADEDIQIDRLDDLVGLERQKSALIENTEAFLRGQGANHALLWGEMGCGKSTLVRATFCEYISQGLRLIEVGKNELDSLYETLEVVRANKDFKFIIFCDDFSFEVGESALAELKRLLEGSIQKPPSNAIFYATSNRKHLVPARANADEYLIKRERSREALSLADRFGLYISFYESEQDEYFALVDRLFGDVGDKDALHRAARAFVSERGVRSPRTAIAFWRAYAGEFGSNLNGVK